jgi:hypothetical protein
MFEAGLVASTDIGPFLVVASVSDPSLITKCARPLMKLRLT